MKFKTTYKARHKLYQEHLSQISDVKFTFREIDVIACVMHSRGDKKIAEILSISPRTVSNHAYNIMTRLNCNSKDQIIDFIEKSGKASMIKEYYHHLLIESSFTQTLQKIGKIVDNSSFTCNIEYQNNNLISQENSLNEHNLLKYIQENLGAVNIQITNTAPQQKQDKEHYIELFVINNKNISSELLSQYQGFGIDKTRKIFLLLNNNNASDNEKKQNTNLLSNTPNKRLANISYIDFSNSQEYYLQFLLLIEKIFYEASVLSTLNNFIQEFKDIYYSIVEGAGNNVTVIREENYINILVRKYASSWYGKISILIIGIVFILLCITGGRLLYNHFVTPTVQTKVNIDELENQLIELVDNFSADNVTLQGRDANHTLIETTEQLISAARSVIDNLSFTGLMNYIYIMNAYAHYELVNNHDWQKARIELEHTRKLILNYIIRHNKLEQIVDDFTALSKEEQYSELHVIMELAKMYNRIIYTLARTYIYEGAPLGGEKYFEIAEYFGKQTGLFEAILSVRNGIIIVNEAKIDIAIKNGNIAEAKHQLGKIINVCNEIQNSTQEYCLEYKPGGRDNLKTIIPGESIYTKITCLEKILQCYSKLISLEDTDNLKNNPNLYQEIVPKSIELLRSMQLLVNANEGPNIRKTAGVYNSIGNALLELYKHTISLENQLKEQLISELSLESLLPNTSDEAIIEGIFQHACNISRHNDYTKADSYDGLIRLRESKIERGDISDEDTNQMRAVIRSYQQKRDQINQKLKRNQK